MRHSRVGSFLLSLLLLTLTSCGGSDGPGGTGPGSSGGTTLSISQTSVTMSFLGATVTLNAALRDQNGQPVSGTVTWTSDNPSVVTVVAGLLTAIQNGTATVTVSSGSLSGTVAVTVQQIVSQIAIVSGADQSATVGQALGDAIVTRSEDAGGAVVAGGSLRFVVSSGGGAVADSTVATDNQGLASTTWTLGTVAGEQHIAVSVQGSTTTLLEVSATGLAAEADSLVKASGDLQSGAIDQPLTDSIVVQLQDEFGNGVAGGEVTFAVTGGGGAVSAETVTTDSGGFAQTVWTLGPTVGAATLSATALGIPTVAFTATAMVPMPDLVAGELSVSPASPTSMQTVTVTVPVTNSGTATPGTSFSVQLLVDGVEVATQTVAPIAPATSADVTFSAGPFAAGERAFSIVVDANGAIAESDESNNTAEQSVDILAQTTLELGSPITGIGADSSSVLLFAFELTAEGGSIEFTLVDGNVIEPEDADIYVKYGSVPQEIGVDYLNEPSLGTCSGTTPDTNETCRINGALPGTYHILIHAWRTFSGVTLSVVTDPVVQPFDIDLVFTTEPTSSQRDAFETAVARWESIIPFDMTDISFENQNQDAGACGIEWLPAISDNVDDIRIYVRVDSIDGSGGVLGRASFCTYRRSTKLPVIGFMEFDDADLAQLELGGSLTSVILHEMGHVLGVGTAWLLTELLSNPSTGNPGADTHFVGPLAVAAFDAAGGTAYSGGKVPVENDGEAGRADGHWRESVFRIELMTPELDSYFEPLSAITVQSLADVGYRVDVSQADAYSLPFLNAADARQQGQVIDLSNDIWIGPMIGVNASGRVGPVKRR